MHLGRPCNQNPASDTLRQFSVDARNGDALDDLQSMSADARRAGIVGSWGRRALCVARDGECRADVSIMCRVCDRVRACG